MAWTSLERRHMQRALELAARGRGQVEPNPMVGCVLVAGDAVVGEGWHRRFGGPHAEIEALAAAGAAARGATMYVTLEPCCHHGKTPPCCDAITAAGIRRVVLAMVDPFPRVAGKGMRQLQQAGLEVDVGLLTEDAQQLNAPYCKLLASSRPWVIAKWAMTLDGKIATRSGDSQWISNAASRAVVHEMRGRMDAILVGRRTVERDDPLLTARPAGPREATRVVLDSRASLASTTQLVRTARRTPVLVVTAADADDENRRRLIAAGCEVLALAGASWDERIPPLLEELGRRRMTNVLVEGGAATLGGLWEADCVDEVHVFIAPKLLGGNAAPSPLAGNGVAEIVNARWIAQPAIEILGSDVHVWGRVMPPASVQTHQSRNPPGS